MISIDIHDFFQRNIGYLYCKLASQKEGTSVSQPVFSPSFADKLGEATQQPASWARYVFLCPTALSKHFEDRHGIGGFPWVSFPAHICIHNVSDAI